MPQRRKKMKANELKKLLADGALEKYSALYSDLSAQTARFIAAIDEFSLLYGEDRDISVFSVPGRSEIIGNHTDHNRGMVMAGAINRDIIAIAAKNEDGVIRFKSEGYPEDVVTVSEIDNPDAFENYTSGALIAGLAAGFAGKGYAVGGFDAYSTTEVLKGSGISSSAAFEVMVGNVINYLYNDGKVDNKEIAKLSRFSENVYFGKPCGLMDQMACAVGGFVFIDFADQYEPVVEPIGFSLSDAGYALCIVNTGGNHANLNDDYASVPSEMRAVAAALGGEVLREFDEQDIIKNVNALREKTNDRAVLRALHYVRENARVAAARDALKNESVEDFLALIRESGRSSFEYLQNVYTTINPGEQGLSLALALTDGYLSGRGCAFRVHGGGFAGTIQAFVKREYLAGYTELMDSVFGDGAAMPLGIRLVGATKLF